MFKELRTSLGKIFDDFGYHARRTFALAAGKLGIKSGAELTQLLPTIVGAEASGVLPLLIGVPASAAFSAAIIQGDHVHNINRILKEYRPEIASVTGKDKTGEPVTEEDLYLVANGDRKRGIPANPTLKEAVEQSAKQRSWGIGISAVSTVIGTIAAMAMKGGIHTFMDEAGIASSMVGFATTMAAGAVAVGLYFPIKWAMHFVAEKAFGLEKETVDGKIHEIRLGLSKGHEVSKEQVLEAYMEAHPSIDASLKEQFGHHYRHLHVEQKEQVLANADRQMGLNQITAAINSGQMRPEELAFLVHGQQSGHFQPQAVSHAPAMAAQAMNMTLSRAHEMTPPEQHADIQVKTAATLPAITGEAPVNEPAYVQVDARSADGNAYVNTQAFAEEKPERKVSYVKMVGGKKSPDREQGFTSQVATRRGREGNMSFVEHVESSSNVETTIPART